MKFRHIGPSAHKSIFKFASPKMGKMFKVESPLEYLTCFHLEYSPDVRAYVSQPGPVEYYLNGQPQNFFPDFWVDSNQKAEHLLEVKCSKEISNQEFRDKFKLRRESATQKGLPLVLITERQICQNPILDNLKLLHHYAGDYSLTPAHDWVLKFVRRVGQSHIKTLIDKSGFSSGEIVAASLTWISRGELQADITDTELGESSLVWC